MQEAFVGAVDAMRRARDYSQRTRSPTDRRPQTRDARGVPGGFQARDAVLRSEP
jgi:hypothetical protein